MSSLRDKSPTSTNAADSAVRTLADATDAAQTLARSAAADKTVMLAQVGALIAHEVNNLLSPALSRCDLLRDVLSHDAAAFRHLDAIQTSVAQAAEISRTILDVAAGDEAKSRAMVMPCIQNVFDNLLPPHASSKVDLRESNPALCVAISTQELSHVVLNVILNALQATRETGGRVLVSARLSQQCARSTRNTVHDFVEIAVIDQGTGVDAGLLSKCYGTLSWERGRFVGKNLGTLLCRLLVERAGGEIKVLSERGLGTTVTVLLPKADYSTSGTSTTSLASTESETELPA